jgi:hypothetical protein
LRLGSRRRRVSGNTRAEVVKNLNQIRTAVADRLPVSDDTRLGPWLDWYMDTVVAHKHPNTAASYQWAIQQTVPLHAKRLRDL